MEDSIAKFCFNCGTPVQEKAKFCPSCGENLQPESSIPTEKPVTPKNGNHKSETIATPHYALLDSGDNFCGYRILKHINKDSEGVKYIAEKDGHQFLLKIFYKSSLSNVQSIFGIQKRLEQLNFLQDKHTVRVVEIDPHHDPAYMVAEYIHGVSLAHIKAHSPERLTEEFIRYLAPQLVKSAIAIHEHQLTLSKLALTNIMVDDNNNAIILSSAVTWEERDEREELFSLAAVFAQALSQHALYRTIYSVDSLQTQKFSYIAGVSLSFNKILAECLHRNILQRYLGLTEFLTALVNLPPLESEEIWSVVEKTAPIKLEDLSKSGKPKTQIEFRFWLLVIIVVGVVAALLTTNIFSVLFSGKGEKLQYSGFLVPDEPQDTLRKPATEESDRAGILERTTYGDLKTGESSGREDFRKQLPAVGYSEVSPSVAPSKPKPPTNMIFVDANTLGFGRLKENLHHNVSLSSFYISRTEVTQAEWNRYMKPANSSSFGEKLPVDNVSWFDIAIYCNGRSEAEGLTPAYKIRGVGASRVVSCDFKTNGYRLPTEAEWEIAAKAGQLYNYSGSDDPDDISWNRDNAAGKIHAPGSKSPNDWGIYDMTGNVAEWVWDWFDANYIRALPTFINPTGPETGTQKVIRGGSINNGEGRNLNILYREKGDPNRGYQFVGFRLVRSS